ncbi:DUF1707 domain-containing protein [Amycolatopsis sp. DG1A-15b]|uniref:DUF1707 domain-containing protein n=1 Tax=Amycolatopsis sp. DG1A-15b TaxID=3052846 RepID=UPI00255B7B66|nr:DUF1707 domain-containing protein [Amycolatopsis sp. DG1A-15b]WIX91267.1 DUF1707 domain-containing protein [Amycolatopsis sp. DG1A-15b]
MTGEVRIGDQARAAATRTLKTALREGRLDLAEYERRLVVVQAARVGKDLTPAVADLPDGSGRTGPGLRISAADREQALVRLAGALTDGRLQARAYADAEELLNRAVTYADVEAVVGNLDAKASIAERDQAVARIEAAVAGGLLDPAEQHDRVAAVRRAATDAQLAALVADLPAGTGPARSPRASHADREAVVARLHDAVEAGVLDLPEFDERVRAVYAARLRDELTRLVADLPEPAPEPLASLPPAPPVDLPAPQPPSFEAGMTRAKIAGFSVFPMIGLVIVLAMAGLTAPAIAVASVSAIVFVGTLVYAKRTMTAAMAAESAPRAENRFVSMIEPFPGRGPTWVDVDPAEWTPAERALGRHKGDLDSITALVLPDGTPVAITGSRDNTARVWDLTDDSWRHTLSGHTHDVVGVAAMVLPDGVPVAVTVSTDRTARVWDLRDGSPRGTLPGLAPEPEKVRCLSLADGTPVAVAHNGINAIQTWDLRDHKRRHNLREENTFAQMVPAILPDGTPVAVVSDWGNHLRVLNLANGKPRFRLTGHTQPVNAIDTTVLADGTPIVVSAGQDKTIRVWDLGRRTLLHTITGLVQAKEAVVCTTLPDGTPVAVACDWEPGNTSVWNLRDGSELPFRFDLWGKILSAVALPDRTLLLGFSDDARAAAVRRLP